MTQPSVESTEELPHTTENVREVKPPSLEENLHKAQNTLENIAQCLRIQVLNNFDSFVSAIRQECPGLDRSKVDKLKTLMDHMLKSPVKRQMNRIGTVAIAIREFKPERAKSSTT